MLAPEQSTGLTSLYSDQTIAGDKGDIYMTIASTYNFTGSPVQVGSVMVQPYTTAPGATWVITGGTGAYAGLQGSGTWFGNAATLPWIYRVATGQVWCPALGRLVVSRTTRLEATARGHGLRPRREGLF